MNSVSLPAFYSRLAIAKLALCVFVSNTSMAQDSAPPQVGEKAKDFTLVSLEGEDVTLSKLTADGPVVLVVLRGYPGYQCPICSLQVGGLVRNKSEIEGANAKVVLVYPGEANELKERAQEFLRGEELPEGFQMVLDPDYAFTNAYGLRWDAPRETAYPSTFVIDGENVIQFAKVSMTHGGRAKPGEVVAALK